MSSQRSFYFDLSTDKLKLATGTEKNKLLGIKLLIIIMTYFLFLLTGPLDRSDVWSSCGGSGADWGPGWSSQDLQTVLHWWTGTLVCSKDFVLKYIYNHYVDTLNTMWRSAFLCYTCLASLCQSFTVCKRSCGKVMFSPAYVKKCVHRGVSTSHPISPPPPAGRHPKTPPLPGRHPPGRHPWQADTPSNRRLLRLSCPKSILKKFRGQ